MSTEMTAERAVSHLFGMDEAHIEALDDYLVLVHTFYLTNEEELSLSYRRECDFHFQQLRILLKALKKMDRQGYAGKH